MVTKNDLVRRVTVTSTRVPQVILFTDRQIQEIKSLCFDKDLAVFCPSTRLG